MGQSKPRAIGVTCGIGSMLVGARNAGFDVIGNVEWRKYYHAKDEHGRNTFLSNFKNSFMVHSKEQMTEEQFKRFSEPEIAYGHPECGAYSQLNANKAMLDDPGDIPLFVDLVGAFRPRFFVMDDLPKSLNTAFPMKKYAEGLPDYDLFPEWVSNWGYGNVQKQRNRFFMLGARKTERWAFVPGEHAHDGTVASVLGDLNEISEGNYPNHDRHTLTEVCAKGKHLRHRDHAATWEEMRDYVINEMKCGEPIKYYGPPGEDGVSPMMIRVGSYKGHWDGPAHVLTGGISGFHPLKGLPYTIRERARLQGFPDDFAFYGARLFEEDGRIVWNHDNNMHMVKQTGKAMPVQFCQYVGEQVMAHLENRPHERATNTRVLGHNPFVSDAKQWYCLSVGYANQERACASCWLRDSCEIRRRYEAGWRPSASAGASSPVARLTPLAADSVTPRFGDDAPSPAGDVMDAVLEYDLHKSPAATRPAPDRLRPNRARSNGPAPLQPVGETTVLPAMGRVRPKEGVKIGEYFKLLIMMDRFTPEQMVAMAREYYPKSKCSTQDVSMARRRIREQGGTPPAARRSA